VEHPAAKLPEREGVGCRATKVEPLRGSQVQIDKFILEQTGNSSPILVTEGLAITNPQPVSPY